MRLIAGNGELVPGETTNIATYVGDAALSISAEAHAQGGAGIMVVGGSRMARPLSLHEQLCFAVYSASHAFTR